MAIKGCDPVAYFTGNRAVKVHLSERALAMSKSTGNLEAHDYYLQAYHHH